MHLSKFVYNTYRNLPKILSNQIFSFWCGCAFWPGNLNEITLLIVQIIVMIVEVQMYGDVCFLQQRLFLNNIERENQYRIALFVLLPCIL